MKKKKKSKKRAAKTSKKTRKAGHREKRKFKRFAPRNFWATERQGTIEFHNQVVNISEGGIFLKGRVLSASERLSTIRLTHSRARPLDLKARALRDEIGARAGASRSRRPFFATAYEFVEMKPSERAALRSFLGNLD